MALQTCFAGVVRQSFHYDETGRLIEVRSDTNPELSEAYRYDGSGNITEKRQGDEVIRMDYDQANQLVSRTDSKGTVDFVYDSAGRMIEEWKGEELLVSYEYGYLDKVILVTRGNEVTKFHYNARGMLMAKERNGKIIETMAWDGIALLSKGDTVYVNEAHVSGGIPLMSVTQGENTFYDNDYLGTTTAVYNQEGQADVKLTGSLGKGTKGENTRFTGKSFDKDLGAHVFPFRNYRSDMGRWTSADPSGFPDGPNQHFYAPVPTTGLDPLGLFLSGSPYYREVPDILMSRDAPIAFELAGYTLSQRAVTHLIYGTTATISDIVLNVGERTEFVVDAAFQTVRDSVQSHVELQAGSLAHFGPPLAGVGMIFGGVSDLALAIHRATVNLTGDITPILRTGTTNHYDYSETLNVSFSDQYDFKSGSNPLVNVFARLGAHGWTSAFNITGSWLVTFQGQFEL